MNDYWYQKKQPPERFVEEIRKNVKGEPVLTLQMNGKEIALMKTDGPTFAYIFSQNRRYLFRGEYTAEPVDNDYNNSDSYVTENGLAGFSLSYDGWLTSLFSNLPEKGFALAAKSFILPRVDRLCCIISGDGNDSALARFYMEFYGFVPWAYTLDDRVLMRQCYGDEFVDTFEKLHGVPRHLFMLKKEICPPDVEPRIFDDYFEAENYTGGHKR